MVTASGSREQIALLLATSELISQDGMNREIGCLTALARYPIPPEVLIEPFPFGDGDLKPAKSQIHGQQGGGPLWPPTESDLHHAPGFLILEGSANHKRLRWHPDGLLWPNHFQHLPVPAEARAELTAAGVAVGGGAGVTSYLNRIRMVKVQASPNRAPQDPPVEPDRARTEPLRDQVRPKVGVARHCLGLRFREHIWMGQLALTSSD